MMATAATRNMRRLSMTMLRERRHRIVAAGGERMAAAEAPGREPGTLQRAVALQGLDGVARTGRFEAATHPEQGAQGVAVHLYEEDQDRSHRLISSCQCRSRLARSSALSRWRATCRACTTMSKAGSSCRFWRKLSRTARLMRVRLAA